VNLFAYGTLMTVEGLREALGSRADAVSFRPARLPGWRRIWNVFRPEWGGGVLNLEPSPADVVVECWSRGWASPTSSTSTRRRRRISRARRCT